MPRKKKRARRGYGTGSIIVRDDGKADVYWYEADGSRGKKKGLPAGQAEDFLAAQIKRVASGVSNITALKREFKTVGEFATHWFSIRLTDANEGDHERYKLHLDPILGYLPPTAITPSLIRDEIVLRKLKTHAPATVRNMVAILSSMMSDMAEDELIPFNPCKNLSTKTRTQLKSDYDVKKAPWISDPAEVPRIFAAMREPLNYCFALGVMAGLRPGEIRGLDWAHINWEHRHIHVQQQASQREHRLKECKDDDSRVVPILPDVYPLLREYHEKCGSPASGLLFMPLRLDEAARKREWLESYLQTCVGTYPTILECKELVRKRFGSSLQSNDIGPMLKCARGKAAPLRLVPEPAEGKRPPKLFIGIHAINAEFHRACRELGLPRMRFYDGTRHTFATHWIVSGGTIEEVKELLGHTTVQVTERYVHMAKGYRGPVNRSLFGVDHDLVRRQVAERKLGLDWRIKGLPAPPPRPEGEVDEDEDEAAEA